MAKFQEESKSVLKRTSNAKLTDNDEENEHENRSKKQKVEQNGLANKVRDVDSAKIQQSTLNIDPSVSASSALPEGFFDDPDLDAKARGLDRAKNLEQEYEDFKKLMQTEEVKSDVIVEKDDTNRDMDRDLAEVDELITRWSKIEDLHKKREAKLKYLNDDYQVLREGDYVRCSV